MHNQNTQALPRIKFTLRFSSLNYAQNFHFASPIPKLHIVHNVKNNKKEGNGQKNNAT